MIDYDLLDAVNFQVNRAMTYKKDAQGAGLPKPEDIEKIKQGDCDDYVILKAHRLVKWNRCSPDDLSFGIFAPLKKDAQYHAMLLAKGQKKKGLFSKTIVDCVYVLDNRTNNIYTLDSVRDKLLSSLPIELYL